MTNEQILEMISMRMNGTPLYEISKKFNVSSKELRDYMPPAWAPANMKKTEQTHDRNIYPNIRDWMRDHEYTYGDVSGLTKVSYSSVINYLTGKSEPVKSFIDKVLGITGMTYETAFSREKGMEKAEPLTRDELLKMNGEPVWCIDGAGNAGWCVLCVDTGNKDSVFIEAIDSESDVWDGDFYGMSGDGAHGLHNMGWLAYRRKQEI